MGLQPSIAQNYDRIVASGSKSYADLADQAEKDNAPAVAAWARAKAAAAGADVTPTDQTPAPLVYASMTVKDLTELAKTREVQFESKWLKNDFVEALEAADAGTLVSDSGNAGAGDQDGDGSGEDGDGGESGDDQSGVDDKDKKETEQPK